MKTEKLTFPLVMKALASLSTVLTAVLVIVYRIYPMGWCLTAAISAGVTAYHLGMRLLVGYVLPAAAGNRFDYRAAWFRPRNWEAGFYRILRLRRWKKYLPTYDPGSYDLSSCTLEQVIRNTCGSELVHEAIMVLSFLPLLMVPLFGELGVFLMTSVLSAIVDSVFVMAQRYNRPRLVRIFEKQSARSS